MSSAFQSQHTVNGPCNSDSRLGACVLPAIILSDNMCLQKSPTPPPTIVTNTYSIKRPISDLCISPESGGVDSDRENKNYQDKKSKCCPVSTASTLPLSPDLNPVESRTVSHRICEGTSSVPCMTDEVPCGFESTNSDLPCRPGTMRVPCINFNLPDNAPGVDKNIVNSLLTDADVPSSLTNLPDIHLVTALQTPNAVNTFPCVNETEVPSSSCHMTPNLHDIRPVTAVLIADDVTPNASLFSDFDTRINRAVQKNSLNKQKVKVKGASLVYSKDLRKSLRESSLTATSEVAQRYLSARASQPAGSKRQSPSSFDQPVRGVPVPPPKKRKRRW